jgi:tetratricopeptide (TPR) repeat protein
MGVRTRAVVPGAWAAAALLAAAGLAALVFLMPAQPPPVRERAGAATASPPPAAAPERGAESVRQRLPATEAEKPDQARASEAPAVARSTESTPARIAPARSESAPPAQQFEGLMTRALGQLERSEWAAAEQSFGDALKLRPGDRAAADGLARAKEGANRDALARLQREAQALEEAERWDEARAAYLRAAAIDPAVDFARQGAARSERMMQLHARLDVYLANPGRLQSPAVRDEAQKLLAALDREASHGARMLQAKQNLAAALKRAATQVTVRFTSDNATEVTLYRVGPLGRFQDREIALTPGTYTLVGSRPGYKDVRLELTVDPDAPAPRVFVACEERV